MGALDAPRPRHWMEQALALAALGDGTTRPNPQVGCVIVRDGEVVGSGFHRVAGQPHAEAIAVEQAGPAARGSTMYVNLEPCAHHGRTPPCVERIAGAGIRRVVASIVDPDPRVDGAGFRRLRELGVEVEVGPLAPESAWLNRTFLHWHRHRRPWVTLKAAASLDGQLSAAEGRSRWITGTASRRFAHRLRLRHDAVLVGAGTVRRDDPRLTVRLPGVSRTPARVVLSHRLDLPAGCALFRAVTDGPPTRVYTAAGRETPREIARSAEVIAVDAGPHGLDLGQVLGSLGRSGVRSVLVEGGGRTHAAFLRAGLADEVALFQAPRLFGSRGGTPLVDAAAVPEPALAVELASVRRLALGGDAVLIGRPAGPRDSG